MVGFWAMVGYVVSSTVACAALLFGKLKYICGIAVLLSKIECWNALRHKGNNPVIGSGLGISE